MILLLAGSILTFVIARDATIVTPHPKNEVYYRQKYNSGPNHLEDFVKVEPLSVIKNRDVVHQAYDYSCGSAALTTILRYYLGRNLDERQVMEGLLHYGESQRIIQRRAFSLLDMKRLVGALGYPSGGFRATIDDLKELDHPAIAPIHYAGFKHFIVIRAVKGDRIFIADPSLGNISFTLHEFAGKWDQNVLFIVFPGSSKPINALELKEEDMRFIDSQTLSALTYRQFPEFNEAREWSIQNELERQKNNPDGTVENTRKQLIYRR